TQSQLISATSGLTLQDTAGMGNFTLTNAANDVGTLTNNVGGNVSYTESGSLALGAGSVGGNTTLVATGAFTQTGAVAFTGTTSLTAGANSITLGNTSNNFGGSVTIVSASSASLGDGNGLDIAAANLSGNLTLNLLSGSGTQT